ncbi:hypothetical protein PR048_010234 [Dryococelus australis]|uniref:Rho-GAP domain-containing protein n=1 Tax=Dryococelus australis TaxID=614101 RepID=A0ABQ9I396_9NEOP|nr:hypothetical protein PR048_010234 [Dryococelus australis]
MSLLAKYLCDLEPRMLIPSSLSKHVTLPGDPPNSAVPHDVKPLFSLVLEQRLDRLIAQLEDLAENSKASVAIYIFPFCCTCYHITKVTKSKRKFLKCHES